MTGGGVSVDQVGLLESPGADFSSSSGAAAVANEVLPCHSAAANVSSIWQRGTPEEMHQGNNITELAELVIENTLWNVESPSQAIFGHSCSMSSLHLDLPSIIFMIQFLSLLT